MTNEELKEAYEQAPKNGEYTAEYLLEWFYHHQKTILAALQSPRVPVIEGLDEGLDAYEKIWPNTPRH